MQVTIDQRFENKEDNPLEIEYKFPVAKGIKVTDFYAEIDGKKGSDPKTIFFVLMVCVCVCVCVY